jgi:hypothetical protein
MLSTDDGNTIQSGFLNIVHVHNKFLLQYHNIYKYNQQFTNGTNEYIITETISFVVSKSQLISYQSL